MKKKPKTRRRTATPKLVNCRSCLDTRYVKAAIYSRTGTVRGDYPCPDCTNG